MEEIFSIYEYLTLYLVDIGVRPSCLFFDSEYSKRLDRNIKKYFPKLIIFYDSFYGYFISKKRLYINDKSDSNDIGKILGYPSDKIPFTDIDNNQDVYGTHIVVTMTDNQQISLLDVKTQTSISEKMLDIMNLMIEKLLSVDCIYHDKIINIRIIEDVHHSIDYYCKKLLMKDELSDDDVNNIYNEIWNRFDKKLSEFNYDFKNNLHIGILISLLLYCKNDPNEHFYGPYYGKCDETKRMIEINKKYSNDIVSALEFASR
jgi:hypothetical protein